MGLKDYRNKRKFSRTPEPKGSVRKGRGPRRFVVQMHRATRLHFDFRLEMGGVFKSWAVPKGPSLNPLDQRLAVFVEDHPLEYGGFEGIIPAGNYGAGTVMIWDEGTYIGRSTDVERSETDRKKGEAGMLKGLAKGHITFILDGEKLKGEFALIKLKKDSKSDRAWLLVKKRDEYASYKRDQKPDDLSVKTGRTMDQIAAQAEKKGAVWHSRPVKKSAVAPKAKADPMPRKNKPMLAVSAAAPASTEEWLIEPDPNGVRALAEVEKARVHLYSRAGLSFDKKFPEIAKELKNQTEPMVLDGEIVKGRGKAIYYVYDILFHNGRDLRKAPLSERKDALKKALVVGSHVKFVEDLPKSSNSIAKKKNSHYHAGISKDWLKLASAGKNAESAEQPHLTHLDKIYFPKDGITKGDVIEYYRSISKYILPYLVDRPESLNRNPNGIAQPGFYQKDMTGHIPRWLKTKRIFSESADKTIDYVLCQDERSLLYLANLGCIEINPWFSRIQNLDNPDFLVIDLDPDGNDFKHVIEIAHEVHNVLEACGADSYCKTSGATGIHIGVPTGARYEFDKVREFAEQVCRIIAKKYPATTSVERTPARRKKKIYLDFMQNRRGQTLAAPFCIRPHPGAPVSMPLAWKELTPRVKPEQFHIGNALKRVEKFGDSWQPVLGVPIDLAACLKRLRKKFAIDS